MYLEHDEISVISQGLDNCAGKRVIGQPLPAFFPVMIKEFEEKVISDN
jgi:hypothetical protein